MLKVLIFLACASFLRADLDDCVDPKAKCVIRAMDK